MSITEGMSNAHKLKLLQDYFDTHTLKLALYPTAADIDKDTAAYTATGEVTGTGYTAGGKTVTGVAVAQSGDVAYVDFDDLSWASSTITARGALIYASTDSDRAIAVIDFGEDISTNNETFEVQAPAPGALTSAIRLA